MKQLQAISLIGYYLLATIGVVVNVHYCHGHVAEISVYSSQGNCRCETGAQFNDCCDDKTFQFQLQEEQQVPVSLTVQTPVQATVRQELVDRVDVMSDAQRPVFAFSPDPPPGPPIWLANQSFIFYG